MVEIALTRGARLDRSHRVARNACSVVGVGFEGRVVEASLVHVRPPMDKTGTDAEITLPWRQIRAITALPFMVLVVIPAVLIWATGSWRPGWGLEPPGRWLLCAMGAFLVLSGLTLMGHTILLFHRVGQGTLAPWDPPRCLVIRGAYRYVRNPMMLGVFSVLAGEVACAGSVPLLLWWLVFVTGAAAVIPCFEEPRLAARLGAAYDEYRRNVPRWFPRVTAYSPARD